MNQVTDSKKATAKIKTDLLYVKVSDVVKTRMFLKNRKWFEVIVFLGKCQMSMS